MKRLFIVDEHISSLMNGVGTFMSTLLDCLKGTDMEVFLLSYNEDVKELSISEQKHHTIVSFPPHVDGGFLRHGWMTLPLLRTFIPDGAENVFLMSHSPCLGYLKTIRRLYPKSKIVFAIHDQGWTAPLLGDTCKLKQIMAARRQPAPYKEAFSTIKSFVREEQRMYALVDGVVCLCQRTAMLLQEVYRVPQCKIHIIPNGIDYQDCVQDSRLRESVRKQKGIREEETLLLYAGRTTAAKGILNLLDAFEQAVQKRPDLRLVIAGAVFDMNEFCARTPKSASRVVYTGQISPRELAEWYDIADIGILPSYTEQCSYTALEMMAHHLPVITTDGNGLGDMFTDGKDAIVVKADPEHLTESLLEAMERMTQMDNGEQKKLSARAYDNLKERYDRNTMGKKYIQLFNTI